ncbi:hypothetical protein [Aurantiacibacter gangjinensis]|uniref:Uncharacterized protein n=1 Tax=Aurantiacibacter gangjinensis TaxID=502682 RepID=A0A0G9MMC1_9SPHN|nr:hypothetical protein [Aurantiacibacter gangjinensis]APE27877.1 hypothetical protein BMF35_a1048 [Aurantiacibacter gangjinensis]KLE31842.1 hypothetical protein AAW01_10205 [Aurantiacibacter gangjinensis]
MRAVSIIAGVAVGLAGLFFASQSASLVAVRGNSQLAAQIGVFPARAQERRAIAAVETDETGISNVAPALDEAQSAFAISPLRTEAAAILALGMEDSIERNAALDATTRLQQRGRLLNFAQLQRAATANDLETGLRAVDRLLTLYPSAREQLFPVLGSFLARDGAIAIFRDLLSRDPSWVNGLFGLRDIEPIAQKRLGQLRLEMGRYAGTSELIDRRLVARLAAQGFLSEAAGVYALISDDSGQTADPLSIDWQDAVPPFDWDLQTERDFHARTSTGRDGLRVRIDSGRGGTIAERLVAVPEGASSLLITHELDNTDRAAPLVLQASCADSAEAAQAEMRGDGSTRLALPAGDCSVARIVISGRALSGQRPIRGEVTGLRFTAD